MQQSKHPMWKKSMLQTLNLFAIKDYLYEIGDNGDCYGYDRCEDGESGYYQEYKELFDELSTGAYRLEEALQEYSSGYSLDENWDDMTVALLGYRQKVLGFDTAEDDYFAMLDPYLEDLAVEEAEKRVKRLSKDEMIRTFRNVMVTLTLFFDIKAAHDCLTSIVEELDYRGAMLEEKNNRINQLYEDLTGKNGEEFDRIIEQIPQRMWIE